MAAGQITALDHFIQFGQFEGRDPSSFFETDLYLQQNPDVAAAVRDGQITAIDHFIKFGKFEGRNPIAQFDTNLYLEQNPDVAAAVQAGELTAFEHFVTFGIQEGRLPAPDFLGTTFDVVVTSAANNGNSAALRFDGLTGSFIAEFPDGGDLIDPRDIVLTTPTDPTDILSVFPTPNSVLINGGNDDTLLFDAESGDFIETFIEFPDLNAGGGVFGPDGNYYAGARSLRTILRFDGETGAFIDQFIPDGVANFPRGFVFGSDGNLYLGNGADPATGSGGGSIVQFDGITGQVLNPNFVTDPQLSPLDVISGLDGNLYVSSEFPFGSADSVGTVRIYDIMTGELLNVLDGGVDERGQPRLSAPRGMGFGPDGNLYVSSTGTSSVLRFDGITGEFMDVFIEFSQLNGQALNFVPSEYFLS